MVTEGRRRTAARRGDENGDLRKGPWKEDEDEVLVNHVRRYGPRDWSSIRSKGLLQRTGKSCRLRWVNKLRPNLKNGVKFSAEEERTVIELQAQFGNKWARIATYLSGRTDNDVKNFWSSRQKRLARILQTSAPSSSSSSTKSRKTIPDFPSNISEESVTKLQSCPSPHPISMLVYEQSPFQFDHTPPEKKPFFGDPQQSHIDQLPSFPLVSQIQPEFPLPLESQEFVTSCLGEPNFLDVFGEYSGVHAAAQIPMDTPFVVKRESHDVVTSDCFVDDYPPIDMFDHLDPLPSPSDW